MKLRDDITMDQMRELAVAMIRVRDHSALLRIGRLNGYSAQALRKREILFCEALDLLWEAQQRAA